MFLRSVASGLAVGIGFVVPCLWPISFIGIAIFVGIVVKAESRRRVVLSSFVVGIISWLFALGAIFLSVLPLDWYGITNDIVQMLLVGISLVISAGVASIGFVFAGFLFNLFYTDSWRDLIVLPIIWVVSEFVGALLSYVFWFGSGSYFGPHFSLGWIGYLIADDKVLLQISSIGGVFALSFIAVFFGVLIYKCIYTKAYRKKIYRIVFVMCVSIWLVIHMLIAGGKILSTSYEGQQRVSLAVVSRQRPPMLYITQETEKKYIDEIYNTIKSLRNVDLLILPEETAFFKSVDTLNISMIDELKSIGVNGRSPVIVDSSKVYNKDGRSLSRVAYYKDGKDITEGYKQFLLPLGEYLPNVYIALMRIFGFGRLVDVVQSVRDYVPGDASVIGQVGGAMVSTRFCGEAMSPILYNDDVLKGSKLLINISSLSWFHSSPVVYMQMQRIAKVRAVESGRWFVQSTNKAPAFILNQYGNVIAETSMGKTEALQMSVPILKKDTVYTRLRRWVSGI